MILLGKLAHQSSPLEVNPTYSRDTFNHISSWLNDARTLTSPETQILLIGNKADLDSQREVTFEEASKFAQEHGLAFIEISAKT